MDSHQFSINILPDEILLYIFRKLSASEFVASLPLVCRRWLSLIASDTFTLNRIGMHHTTVNSNATVNFFSLENYYDEQLLNYSSDNYGHLLNNYSNKMNCSYSNIFYLCVQHSEIYSHIKTLVVSFNLFIYPTEGFTYLNNLTTLIFYDVNIQESDKYTLLELGSVYLSIENVSYIKFSLSIRMDLKYLHVGFKKLKRFHIDHFLVSNRLLEELLKTHSTLETIVFGHCTIDGDRWLDVLMDKLKGVIVKRLSIHSSYFTDDCVNKFLTSNLVPDKSKVNIYHDKVQIPFSITIG